MSSKEWRDGILNAPQPQPATLHDAQRGWWVQQQDAAEARALGSGTPFTRQQHWPLIPAGLD